MSKAEIGDFSRHLGIPFLVHFTRIENLPSIINSGLYPVDRFGEIGATPKINDQLRLDGRLNGLSLSIAFPNSRMFYKCRMGDEEADWVVLAVAPSVLGEKDCAFCRHNAADARISSQELGCLKGIVPLRGMFDEIGGLPSRQEQALKNYDPTDVQAEALVFDVIEPGLISGVVFSSKEARDAHRELLGSRRMFVHPKNKGVFADRTYFRKYR
jgi:hypothetical protein